MSTGRLSDEQIAAVELAGLGTTRTGHIPTWRLVALPEGPQQIPAWAKGLEIEWNDQYANPPTFKLKTDRDLRTWDDKRFTRDGDRYLAVSSDGRAECYYQSGALRQDKLSRYRTQDGKLHTYRPPNQPAPGEWIEVERLCTPQQDGFGGAHIDITLDDGREVTLRGPWHGPCPAGFVEASYAIYPCRYLGTKFGWTRATAQGGLFLTLAAMIPIFARYQPHLRLAMVDAHGRGDRLEAMGSDWHEPKAWRYARRLNEARAATP